MASLYPRDTHNGVPFASGRVTSLSVVAWTSRRKLSASHAVAWRRPGNVSDVRTSRVRHDLALPSRDRVAEHHGHHTCTRDADEEGHQPSKVFGHANLPEKRVVVTDASRLFSRRTRQLFPWWDHKVHTIFVRSELPVFRGSDHPSLIPFPTIQPHSDIPPISSNHRFSIHFNGSRHFWFCHAWREKDDFFSGMNQMNVTLGQTSLVSPESPFPAVCPPSSSRVSVRLPACP